MTEKLNGSQFVLIAGLCVGLALAVFAGGSMLVPFDHSVWLTINNTLVIFSLILIFFIGFDNRQHHGSISKLVLKCAIYVLIVMTMYVGSYAAATYFIPERLSWMPFFHRDYTYHGYASVVEFMNKGDNYRDLLVLQIFSCAISSVLYFAAAFIGHFAGSFRAHMLSA